MLNSRRALVAAFFIIVVIYFITRSHDEQPVIPQTASSGSGSSSSSSGSIDNTKSVPSKDDSSSTSNHASSKDDSSNAASDAKGTDTRPLKPAVQKPMADMSHLTTYDKLAYAYPYDLATKFPAYIWQTWKYTPADVQFDFRDQEASWSIAHPGFVHQVVTDEMAITMLRLFYAAVPEVLEAYIALPMPVLKADFFRYLILFARGGVYSDIDTFAIQSALEWIPEEIPHETVGLVIGIEADPDRPDWADWYSRRIQFCQWTIQAKPGHPVLRDVISRITNATLTLKREGQISKFLNRNVVDLTGPAVWTDTIMEYFNDERFFKTQNSKGVIDWHNFTGMEEQRRVGDVVVLPITSFSPGVGQMGAKEPDDEMAFVQHGFEGTWKPENERHMGE